MRIILASKSPRRRELLGAKYSEFEIITESTDETLPEGMHPREGVAHLAVRKGSAVVSRLAREGQDVSECLVISSDTLVELDGEALGKPEDVEDAVRMLMRLSGRVNNVHTGVAVQYRGRVAYGTASTAVYFRDLSENEAREYVASGEPMDKAGAYAIQGIGGKFVDKIEGDFDTVVGLSMRLLDELCEKVLVEA